MSEGFEDAGRRIKAAVISYLMSYKGVDLTLKEMGDEDPGEFWSDLAEQLVVGQQLGLQKELLTGKRNPDKGLGKKHSDETIQ